MWLNWKDMTQSKLWRHFGPGELEQVEKIVSKLPKNPEGTILHVVTGKIQKQTQEKSSWQYVVYFILSDVSLLCRQLSHMCQSWAVRIRHFIMTPFLSRGTTVTSATTSSCPRRRSCASSTSLDFVPEPTTVLTCMISFTSDHTKRLFISTSVYWCAPPCLVKFHYANCS